MGTSISAGFALNSASQNVAAEDEGTVVHLRDAAGEPMFYGPEKDLKPVTITVAGSYSSVFRKAERAFNSKLGKVKRSGTSVTEIMERRALELTAACVLAWDGLTYDGEKPLPCTPQIAETVFEQARWIFDQAFEASNDHAGFSKPSSGR